ncbi:hypothetical protein EsH8_X_000410 [Colletotrichum jinshuiense]
MRFLSSACLFAGAAGASLSSIASQRCSDGLLSTPSFQLTGALFTVCAEAVINAPIGKIYEALIDFRRYSTWNTFVVEAVPPPGVLGPGDVYVGMPMAFTSAGLIPGANASSNEIVTVLEPSLACGTPPRAVNAWRNDDGLNNTLLPAEHPNLLTDLGNGSVRIVSFETYYLPGAATVIVLKGALEERFAAQAQDLKRFVEGTL